MGRFTPFGRCDIALPLPILAGGYLGKIKMHRYYWLGLWSERLVRRALIAIPLALLALLIAVMVAG